MNATPHTPAPWHLGRAATDPAIYGPRGEHVATLPDMLDPDEILGNARLIAAAPDLLNAAKAALAWIEKTQPYEHGNPALGAVWGCLEQAIAKANPST